MKKYLNFYIRVHSEIIQAVSSYIAKQQQEQQNIEKERMRLQPNIYLFNIEMKVVANELFHGLILCLVPIFILCSCAMIWYVVKGYVGFFYWHYLDILHC